MAPPRQLFRYSQVRRQDQVDVQVDDDRFQRGRYFHASCLSSDVVNSFVYVTGTALGIVPVTTVDILDPLQMPAIGVLVEKTAPTIGLVQVKGLFTPGFTVVPQQLYWVGISGFAVPTPPTFPALKQLIGIGLDATTILLEPSLSASNQSVDFRDGVALLGARDGVNRTFTTPDLFLNLGGSTIKVMHNGRRLIQAPSPNVTLGDYYVVESGGLGTGFNTIVLLAFTPTNSSQLIADYIAV